MGRGVGGRGKPDGLFFSLVRICFSLTKSFLHGHLIFFPLNQRPYIIFEVSNSH